MSFAGRKVLVLGLGDTGLSMAKWLARRGASVRVADTRTAPPRLAELKRSLPSVPANCGPFQDETFADIDLLAVSPGVPLAEPGVRRALDAGTEVVGDVELFARALPERHPPIIAVTGTNGKSTVTSLAGAMTRAAGVDCEVAGNIGPAVLDALMRREDIGRDAGLWVLELSSFQLETTTSLAADAAAVLNITEDHLDRYRGIDDYARAKARVFSGDGIQVLNRDDPRSLAMALPGRKTSTFGLDAPRRAEDWGVLERGGEPWLAQGANALLAVREMRLAGLHNAANALAALALCRALGLPLQPLLVALREFKGLPHRVELIGEADGVRWYDDSKGTNVGSTVAALAGLAQGDTKLVLIAGGDGKGQDFSPLRSAVERSARGLVLIGRDAPLIEAAVAGAGVPIRRAASMDQAVALAAQAARPGDAVLLSPACASFDMFRDYRHRGEVFRLAVERVIDAAKH
ncbi:MAG: UDP-N-acetylmuramoyl-L-alanine--D-glutamate ligase [Betaproteobacteria bacterium]|nr:MAG: UDP-N-acetylmuramoyl-L-alanine--D-glutamate ligase [Betaproteobacteria bacterium]